MVGVFWGWLRVGILVFGAGEESFGGGAGAVLGEGLVARVYLRLILLRLLLRAGVQLLLGFYSLPFHLPSHLFQPLSLQFSLLGSCLFRLRKGYLQLVDFPLGPHLVRVSLNLAQDLLDGSLRREEELRVVGVRFLDFCFRGVLAQPVVKVQYLLVDQRLVLEDQDFGLENW